jgi:hypothetical protein
MRLALSMLTPAGRSALPYFCVSQPKARRRPAGASENTYARMYLTEFSAVMRDNHQQEPLSN